MAKLRAVTGLLVFNPNGQYRLHFGQLPIADAFPVFKICVLILFFCQVACGVRVDGLQSRQLVRASLALCG